MGRDVAESAFEGPLFKLISHNDSGLASGKQAGFLIPKEMRAFFPPLPAPTDTQPSPSVQLRLILQLDLAPPTIGLSSWRFESWGNTRPPESRVTANLDSIRAPSRKDDILLIERNCDDEWLYRLTVITQGGPLYNSVLRRTRGQRWGVLEGGIPPVRNEDLERAISEISQHHGQPFEPFESTLSYLPPTRRIARSRAFRKLVVAAYENACAVCGSGLVHPDGRSELEAAHVIPRGSAGADDVRNGLALCRQHHWAFDNQIIGLNPDRKIVCAPDALVLAANAGLQILDGADLQQVGDPALRLHDFAVEWAYNRYLAAWPTLGG